MRLSRSTRNGIEPSRTAGVRRLYLGRIEYFIYYKADAKAIRVLAFWGASRGKQPVT